ncbi:MAG: hypothetical protein A2Z11_01825 [Candidatus Woykebacteria bacterium RBG_16_43_9]|uniref:Uncharacterized protein n=1 Tax=Candidatus Woykebacteria bacterium RBG_16_43_9 TaxID=1802596 RepID=A0A1G1WC45_9BACT|nr:MAG: hypothetical protein A2Z11_01825 [Candidatus Woykebacteria bacterium RBG_16_43_9]
MAKEIVIDIKQKENKFKTYAPWIATAVLVAAAFFIIGFGIGKYTQVELPLFSEETATKSATRKNWFVFETKNFSIEYPKNWEVKKNSKDKPAGGKVLGSGGKVEFWFDTIRAYKFSKEQTKKQSKTTTTKLEIDGRKADVTTYPYKGGDFFIVIEVPKVKKKPKVTFWLNVADSEFKKTVMEIVSTFKTNSVIGKIGQAYE